jgi:hypothetical protein
MSNGGPVISRRVSQMKVLPKIVAVGGCFIACGCIPSPTREAHDCRNAGLLFVLFSAQADRKALRRVGMLNSNACMST